jgi:hypothetical protein
LRSSPPTSKNSRWLKPIALAKRLNRRVELRHRVVEEPPRRRKLVLHIAQIALQLLEVRARLQVGISLRQRE